MTLKDLASPGGGGVGGPPITIGELLFVVFKSGIITQSDEVGMALSDQLAGVYQSVLTVPLHTFLFLVTVTSAAQPF